MHRLFARSRSPLPFRSPSRSPTQCPFPRSKSPPPNSRATSPSNAGIPPQRRHYPAALWLSASRAALLMSPDAERPMQSARCRAALLMSPVPQRSRLAVELTTKDSDSDSICTGSAAARVWRTKEVPDTRGRFLVRSSQWLSAHGSQAVSVQRRQPHPRLSRAAGSSLLRSAAARAAREARQRRSFL